jgi:hypothetical protein
LRSFKECNEQQSLLGYTKKMVFILFARSRCSGPECKQYTLASLLMRLLVSWSCQPYRGAWEGKEEPGGSSVMTVRPKVPELARNFATDWLLDTTVDSSKLAHFHLLLLIDLLISILQVEAEVRTLQKCRAIHPNQCRTGS